MKQLKLLIIDDDLVVQALLKVQIMKHYESIGVTDVLVDCVASIEEAHRVLELMVKKRSFYDLVFLDLTLDHRNDGMHLIPVIKSDFKKTLIVVITAETSDETLLKTDSLGASGYIVKPLSSMMTRINDILERLVMLKKLEAEMLGK